ncbi:MAG: O-antigen polymerase [Terriglobales bacterium]
MSYPEISAHSGATRRIGASALLSILAAFTFAAIGIFAWSAATGPYAITTNDIIIGEAVLVFVVAFGPFVWRRLTGETVDFFEPGFVFAIIYVIVFTVRPIFLLSPWVAWVDSVPAEINRYLQITPDSMALAVFYGLLGIIFFQLGYGGLHIRRSSRPAAPQDFQQPRRVWLSDRVRKLVVGGIVFASVSWLLVAPAIGNLSNVVGEFGRVRALLVGYGYQGLGIDLLPVVALFAWVDHLQGRRRWIVWPLVIFSNVYNIMLGSRAGVYSLWLYMFLAYRYMTGKSFSRKQWIAGALLVALIFVFAMSAGELRNEEFHDWSSVRTSVEDFWTQEPLGRITATFLLEFDQVDIFATVLTVGPRTFPFLWGESYAELLLQPIPRWIWPDKPWPYDVNIGWYAAQTQTAIPPSMVGELYMNFHIVGVTLGMFLFGALFRSAYRYLVTDSREPAKILLYSLLLPYLPLLILRSFVGAGTTLAVLGIPAWLATRYVAPMPKQKPMVASAGRLP